MQQSESIKNLAAALSKAQAEITGAVKDSSNPFYKSKYADLTAVIAATKDALAGNQLSVSQLTDFTDEGVEFVETQIMHSSGEWIRGRLPIKAKDGTPQAQGSGISYVRRYALQAALNVPSVDDDGEAAQIRQPPRMPQAAIPAPQPMNPPAAPINAPLIATGTEKTAIGGIEGPQIWRINGLITKTKVNPEFVTKRIQEQFGVREIAKLNSQQAAWLIQRLEQQREK